MQFNVIPQDFSIPLLDNFAAQFPPTYAIVLVLFRAWVYHCYYIDFIHILLCVCAPIPLLR